MHAFGDECIPLEESVHMMEVILRQEISAFLFICERAAELRGTKILGLRECIYTMRSDKANLSRLFKYLGNLGTSSSFYQSNAYYLLASVVGLRVY
jgi:hypothetical protein